MATAAAVIRSKSSSNNWIVSAASSGVNCNCNCDNDADDFVCWLEDSNSPSTAATREGAEDARVRSKNSSTRAFQLVHSSLSLASGNAAAVDDDDEKRRNEDDWSHLHFHRPRCSSAAIVDWGALAKVLIAVACACGQRTTALLSTRY